jgi:hypothetical protein
MTRSRSFRLTVVSAAAIGLFVAADDPRSSRSDQTRPIHDDVALKKWLVNMLVYHRYSAEEAGDVLGYDADKVKSEAMRLNVGAVGVKPRRASDPLTILPYPGGRHPRIGFLEGAVDPQRETKFSVFTPWDPGSYVVVDVPEAIFSDLGLTYLAHTHIPTIFDKEGVKLERLEWTESADGSLSLTRKLPNGIVYKAWVRAYPGEVRMELELTNGTNRPLSDLRVQQCAMLKGARGFEAQTNDNKRFDSPYAIVHDPSRTRWIVHAWSHPQRVWGNPPCPCLHSDPQFPDLKPGETGRLIGRLWFYEGRDIDGLLNDLKTSGWDR